MKLKNMFKKTNYISLKEKNGTKPEVPEGLLKKCNVCKAAIIAEDVKRGYYICPKCHNYFRVHARRRIELIADENSFEEWNIGLETKNPLHYKGYEEKIKAMQEKTGLDEAVLTGKVQIEGQPAAVAICDSRFIMASMGEVVGEKITRTIERATEEKLPIIIFACSGGARMQEGIVSLMQMAKTSAALKRHSDAGLLYISVLTNPTTGGVTASFAMLGDIILAEPNALIGFAGPRVIEQTIGQKLPKGFQRSEFLLEHGFIDNIVERETMKEELGKILEMHNFHDFKTSKMQNSDAHTERTKQTEQIKQIEELEIEKLEQTEAAKTEQIKQTEKKELEKIEIEKLEQTEIETEIETKIETELEELEIEKTKTEKFVSGANASTESEADKKNKNKKQKCLSAWDRVELSRRKDRPVGSDYIKHLFTDFIEFHGDRYFKDDKAIVGGIAKFHGEPVTVIAQEKGSTTKENIARNFGMPSPDGYRKALRLMRQAEKFHRPIICLVDTPGAFCGIEAEERGQGEAIAKNLFEMSGLTVPILSLIIGEGGSGGALAMAVADEVWIMENSIYSILSPEGFASILWKDSKRAKEAAEVMKLTAQDLKAAGIVERVIAEDGHLTAENISNVCENISSYISEFLKTYEKMTKEELTKHRYERFRKY